MALTFFAFLGFGVITFAATSLANPRHDLPRAMYLALGIATVIYVAVALGVFGTLTVQKVISSGGTALAVAAEPVLGSAGYHLMTVTPSSPPWAPPTRGSSRPRGCRRQWRRRASSLPCSGTGSPGGPWPGF